MTEINDMASQPTSKYVYSVNTAGDLSRLTRIITNETCRELFTPSSMYFYFYF